MQAKKETIVTFSDRLKMLMEQHGLNSNQLAEKLEISHVAIGNYLRDKKRMPHPGILVPIADFFGVTTDFLLRGEYPDGATADNLTLREDGDLRSAKEDLSELHQRDPASFKTVRDVIGTYRRNAQQKRPANSKLTSEQEAALDAAERAAARERQTPSPKPATDGPSARKLAPSRGASKDSKEPPSPRGPAPK